jgi:serpin B
LVFSLTEQAVVEKLAWGSERHLLQGQLEVAFLKERTKEDKFHRLDGSVVDAQFMKSFGSQFIGVHDGFKVLPQRTRGNRADLLGSMAPPGLPRTVPRRRYSMYVLLPDTRDGLQGLMDAVASSSGFRGSRCPSPNP